jgi:hypothetical protein
VLRLDAAFGDGCGLTHAVRSCCRVEVELLLRMEVSWWLADRGRQAAAAAELCRVTALQREGV